MSDSQEHIDRIKAFSKSYFIPLMLTIICLAIYFSDLNMLLRYQRSDISIIRSWSLLSANFTHLSLAHLAANLAAVFIIWSLFWLETSRKIQLLNILILSVAVGIGVHFFSEEVKIYTGFSGTAHGLIISGALITLTPKNTIFNGIVIVGTLLKHAHEHFSDDKTSPLFNNGYVVTDAHQYGIIAAFVFGICFWLYKRAERKPLR